MDNHCRHDWQTSQRLWLYLPKACCQRKCSRLLTLVILNCCSQVNILSASARLSQPYRSTIIISVIRDIFFSGPVPFVTRHQDHFPCHHGPCGTEIWQVPKALVALVATAVRLRFWFLLHYLTSLGISKYYAALKEWSTGVHKHSNFTVETNFDVYKGHVDSIDNIEKTQKRFHFLMMADIYRLVSYGPLSYLPTALPLISLALLAPQASLPFRSQHWIWIPWNLMSQIEWFRMCFH